MPTTADGTGNLGPGTLKIGQTGTLIDCSCLVNNAVISADKDEGDTTTKLCGTQRVGAITYTYSLSGNMDVDAGKSSGFFALTQSQAGAQVDYEFTPSTAMGTKAVGKLVLDPLDFGADEYGAALASDFEFSCTGKPTYTYGGVLVADESEAEAVA